jgi:hypothetical protein
VIFVTQKICNLLLVKKYLKLSEFLVWCSKCFANLSGFFQHNMAYFDSRYGLVIWPHCCRLRWKEEREKEKEERREELPLSVLCRIGQKRQPQEKGLTDVGRNVFQLGKPVLVRAKLRTAWEILDNSDDFFCLRPTAKKCLRNYR